MWKYNGRSITRGEPEEHVPRALCKGGSTWLPLMLCPSYAYEGSTGSFTPFSFKGESPREKEWGGAQSCCSNHSSQGEPGVMLQPYVRLWHGYPRRRQSFRPLRRHQLAWNTEFPLCYWYHPVEGIPKGMPLLKGLLLPAVIFLKELVFTKKHESAAWVNQD